MFELFTVLSRVITGTGYDYEYEIVHHNTLETTIINIK